MGNTQATPVKPVGSKFPFTFGPELELVLKFKPGRYEQAVRAYPEWRNLLRLEDMSNRNAKFAVFIAELITKYSDGTIKCLAAASKESKELGESGNFYDGVWQAAVDQTLHVNPNNGEYSVELVSPIQSTESYRWQVDIAQIWSILATNFEIRGTSGSTHVHMRQVTSNKKEELITNIAFAKAVAKFIVFWEPCLWRLAPLSRQNEPYAKANMAFNPNLKTTLQRGQAGGMTYADVFDIIEDLCDPKGKAFKDDQIFNRDLQAFWESYQNGFKPELAKLTIFITGTDRAVAWNLHNLCAPGKETGKVSGTIEYRRPPPSKTLGDAYRNVTLSLCFAYGAVKFAKVGHPMYEHMRRTKVVAPDANLQIPKNMDQFAADHEAEFEEWMREAARDLNLEKWLVLTPPRTPSV